MAVNRRLVLPLLEAAVEVGRQRHAGIDAVALEHLDQYRADRWPGCAEPDDVDVEGLGFAIGPDTVNTCSAAVWRDTVDTCADALATNKG